ncbi:amino acid ABC transporter ATP-binding protein [Fenollaria timonensis]|jgi:ABC-type polar amino acid transport system ATPase subunit|uniref:amino acid ABC transporter ATP-binding protein n=1 Tax=Fenollaria timonensis TaxID=1723384 RepID=UPI0026EC3185|nr:amino acid ABC transporter ATP-binding protein [Fenollaria timonensis]
MLKIHNLNKSYEHLHVLKDINIEIEENQVVAIIGPSGSGKSTLLRCINYLEKPETGTIEIDGACVNAESHTIKDIKSLRSKTSMVFQNYNLFANKTCLQNVLIPLEVVRSMRKQEANIVAKELLAKVGLSDKMNSYPAHMSGGQQQRAGIARALAVNPKCILFDEPTSSLDPELVYEVQEVIRQLTKEDVSRTMIIVTHEMAFAKEVADRVIYLEDGKACIDLTSEEFFSMENVTGRISRFINKV